MASKTYDANSISVLEGLEAVRKRPGMYIGSVSTKGLNHLIYEIVDNSVDEFLAGYCNEITVSLNNDGTATIIDNGRGIPVGINERTGKTAVEMVFTMLHAGGKFGDGGYKISGGLHGVGASVVNALSTWLTVTVRQGGKIYQQKYERGKIITPLEVIGTCRKSDTGTKVQFLPDPEIFDKTYFKAAMVRNRLHETAYLNPNLTIHYINQREGEETTVDYHEPEGICAYVKKLNEGKQMLHEPVYFKRMVDGIEAEVAFQYTEDFGENILGFCNNIYTIEGGTHITGFKTKFTTIMNQYAREIGVLKEKDANFTGTDVRNGMTAIVSVKHPEPRFEGQTKTKLDNPDAAKAVGEIAAYLNPNLTIHYINQREGEETTVDYHEPEGICAYVKKLNEGKQMLHEPVYFKRMVDGIEAEVAFQYTEDFGENILGFCNNIYTIEGGTHITGFKTKFTTIMNQYAREIGVLKEKDANFTGTDVRNGMTAIVSVKHPEPRFEGQTKTKLDNPDAAKAVGEIAGEELVLYFDKNLDTLKKVLACAEKSAKIRKAEEKAKTNMLVKQKLSIDSNGKLANCESRKAEECEIFIVEGDSAGGSAKTARNRKTQAILPIRGKILNVEKATMDKVLANAEIKTMINSFGCGFSEGYGNDFDITKLRYHKIIIMTDADVDGAHIATLLLTFFYRFMPELITHGHVYLATPPLYKAMPKKGEETYLYDDVALSKYRANHKGSFTLQRYKGLGEMDAQQLWETTLNPESRTLKQIEIEDARMASDVTSMLMGSDVPPRRQFIYENANDAMLDI